MVFSAIEAGRNQVGMDGASRSPPRGRSAPLTSNNGFVIHGEANEPDVPTTRDTVEFTNAMNKRQSGLSTLTENRRDDVYPNNPIKFLKPAKSSYEIKTDSRWHWRFTLEGHHHRIEIINAYQNFKSPNLVAMKS
jgi:hypothetical protein